MTRNPAEPRLVDEGASALHRPGSLLGLATAAGVVMVCTGASWLAQPWVHQTSQAMIHLVGVLWMAARLSRRDAILGALASAASFDFFFVEPVLGFTPTDVQGALALVAFVVTSFVVSGYATRVRAVAESVRQEERRTSVLYAMSRALSAEPDASGIASIAKRHVEDLVAVRAWVSLASPPADLAVAADFPGGAAGDSAQRARQSFFTRDEVGSESEPGGLHVPLQSARGVEGVLSVERAGSPRLSGPARRLLDTLAALTAVALERAALARQAADSRAAVEAERARNALLSAVSHDLRTPLASIKGAAGALLSPASTLSESSRRELVEAIHDEGDRLGRLVANLLDLARVEARGDRVRKEWYPVDELVGTALERVRPRLGERRVDLDLPDSILQLHVDGLLFEQVVVNLLENAAKHTPAGSPVAVSVRADGGDVRLEVRDDGPGFAPEDAHRIFDGFYRAPTPGRTTGTGLGLTLCRAIVRAHGGRIAAENRPGGGASILVWIPREEPPRLPDDEEKAPSERSDRLERAS
jgi:two-component system sensor histidine kinase KdpD